MSTLPPGFTLLQVIPELETGGAEQTTLDIAAAIVRDGGRALVATRGGRMVEKLQAVGGIPVIMPAQSKNPLTLLLNAGRMAQLIKSQKVSLIHARSRAPAFSALWAAQITGIPFVATYHGVYNAKGSLKRWYNAVMTRGEMVIANSQYTRDHVLVEHGVDAEKVVAIPRGIDLDRFDPSKVAPERVAAQRAAWGIEPDETRLVFLLAGRLTRWKGQAVLVDAATRLAESGETNFIIVLAGDDQGREAYRGELEAAISQAGLIDHIRLAGHVDDMPAAYLAADIALAPSIEPEAFGRTAVEPQIMGRPVIAADHGAAKETVIDGRTGWRVIPGDPRSWSEALDRAIKLGRAQLRLMGEGARQRAVKLYSVKAMTDATLALYADLLQKRRR